MEQTKAQRLAGLDTLRATAIMSVMVFHLNWRLPQGFAIAGKFGWMGVDLFFVLSGYLIGSQLLKTLRDGRGVDLLRFYRNRAYRILPAYLVVLALYLAWPGWREETSLSPLWEFLTFTENLFVDYWNHQAFSHVWSLCVEEHFYLLLPLIVLGLARKPAAWKAVAALGFFLVLGLAVRSYELLHMLRPMGAANERYDVVYIQRIYYPTYARLDGLLAGVGLSLLRVFRPLWWSALVRRSNWLLGVGSVLVGCAVWMFWDRFTSVTGAAAVSSVIGFPMLSLGLAMWVCAAADTRCWLGRRRVPGAKWVAMLAYSLYLTHKEVAHMIHAWFPQVTEARDWWSVVLYGVGCIAAGAVLYYAVERPFLKLRDRRDGRGVASADVEARVEPAL